MILESGAKANTVKKYLGKEWIVQACGGHVEDLPGKGSKDSSIPMWESDLDTCASHARIGRRSADLVG